MPRTLNHYLGMWFLLVLVDQWEMAVVALGPLFGRGSSATLLWLAWGWLALTLATIAALFFRPRWASVLITLLIPLSTVLLSLSWIPFLMTLVPTSLRFGVLVGGNVFVLGASLLLLHRAAASTRIAAAG